MWYTTAESTGKEEIRFEAFWISASMSTCNNGRLG